MTKSFNQKVLSAFKKLGVVALITATLAVFFTACKQTGGEGGGGNTGGGGKPTPNTKHAITFSVEGGNGKLKAKADGMAAETERSPITVEQGKTVTFTAEANKDYKVKEWKVDGTVVAGNTSKTYTHTVTKAVEVKVSFESNGTTPPSKPKYTVTFSVEGEGGKLKAKAEGEATETETSPIEVEEGKTVTFMAEANKDYKVKEWKVDGTVVAGNTSKTYTHTVTKAVEVKVSFDNTPVPEGKAILTLDASNKVITVWAKTADGSDIQVEGCSKTAFKIGERTRLNATGTTVTLKGKISELDCYGNKLTAIDVQGLTSLKELNCSENQLTAIDLHGLTALQKLRCHKNQLKSLDMQGLTALQMVWCYENQLSAIDVHGLNSLQELNCGKNKLTALNVQGCIALKELLCYNNQLTDLDVKGLTALQEFSCSNNQLKSLDVQGLTSLKELQCYANQIPELNVKGLTALQRFDCYENQLKSLDVQGLTALQLLDCNSNQLTELVVQGLTALERIDCYKNKLASLDVQGLTALNYLACHSNQLNAEEMTKLLNALPARSETDYAKARLYTERTGVDEGNHKDFNDPATLKTAFDDAKKKNWQLRKIDAGGYPKDI